MTKIEQFANDFADAVRDAFAEVYGPPKDDPLTWSSVRPTWSDKGVAQGWHDPDPRVALVGTEYSWIQDMWRSGEDHALWEAVAAKLTADGWGNVAFDSINPGIHIVFIDLPHKWGKILMQRAIEKSR